MIANSNVVSLLEQVNQLKKQLDSIRPIDEEAEQRVMQKLRLDWNYHSNHLEGNQLTYGETKALIMFGLRPVVNRYEDHVEAKGHNEAIEYITEVVKEQRPLSESFIREVNKLILPEAYSNPAVTERRKANY